MNDIIKDKNSSLLLRCESCHQPTCDVFYYSGEYYGVFGFTARPGVTSKPSTLLHSQYQFYIFKATTFVDGPFTSLMAVSSLAFTAGSTSHLTLKFQRLSQTEKAGCKYIQASFNEHGTGLSSSSFIFGWCSGSF